jgi:hypothetical protein
MTNTFSAMPGLRRMAQLLCAVCAVLLLAATAAWVGIPGWIGALVAIALGATGVAVALPAAGGCLAVARQARLEAGRPDLFLQLNRSHSEEHAALRRLPKWSALRRGLAAAVFGHRLLVGDAVRVRPLHEIRATLDAQSCLDGLPFMDEMAAFCGRDAVVYRVVDKIYDYGRSRVMRRLDDCVLLTGLRCDGGAHGGCEAACYLIWKSQWLEPLPDAATPSTASREVAAAPAPERAPDQATVYSCQYTQLTAASQAMRQRDWRRLLGPWIVGNVTASAFWVALATRAFNALQESRAGVCYPARPDGGNEKTVPTQSLQPGQWVRVRSFEQIARTLDKNSKNRGLWFDRDMLKHCGSLRQVRSRVHKIIDIHTGTMIPMKTACIMLEDVHYSGEFQGFGEQHDYLYWREAWLEPVEPGSSAGTATPTP